MEYVIYLLLSIAVIVAFIQMLFVEHLEIPAAEMGGTCVDGFRAVGDKCVSIDPTASIAPRGPAPCPTGCTFYNGGCLKDDTIYCMDQQRKNEPKCISIKDRSFSEAQCPYGTCPGGNASVNGSCVGPCPPGKKVQGGLCVSDNGTAPAAPVFSPVGAPSCKIENFADF